MGELHFIDLRAMTRDDREAATEEDVRVLFGTEEVAAFPVPPQGQSNGLSKEVAIPFDEGEDLQVSLRVPGADAWGPREVIVTAEYSRDGGPRRTYAVAVARPEFDDPSAAGLLISEDSPDAVARWNLARFRAAGDTDLLDQFLAVLATDGAYATTEGPLELTVRASIGGVPVIVFQTVLPTVGRQEPGDRGGYMYRFQLPKPGIPFSMIHSVSIANRSDDAWGVAGAELYGWGMNQQGQPVGGLLSEGPSQQIVSQEISDRFPEPAVDLHLDTGWQKNPTTDAYQFRLLDCPLAL